MEKSSKNKKTSNPFEDYMWMENMEEFDRQVEEELCEEEFIRTCIEQLLDEEEERETLSVDEIRVQQSLESLKITNPKPPAPQQYFRNSLNNNLNRYPSEVNAFGQRVLSASKLNPNAKVFVPSGVKMSS